MGLVVWTRAENAIDGQPTQPLIVVISRCKRDISSQITSHYLRDDYKRWDRLNGNHAWVYLDLYFLFTRWDRVWGAVKQNLSIRTEASVIVNNINPSNPKFSKSSVAGTQSCQSSNKLASFITTTT
jgi:hypothetical protein